jgi:CheY-like chemotaxis protein
VVELSDVSGVALRKIRMRKERTDLAAIVNRAVETTRAGVEAHHQLLDVELPDKHLWIEADPTRMAQVVGNLLANASKYTDEGGRISVRVAREGGDATIWVRDTGVGIPRDALGRIFDDFYQVGGCEDRSRGGLGIGLSLVRRLVKLHGGNVQAYSDGVGQGAEFVVRVPALEPYRARPEGPPKEAERRPSARLRVLVIDDNRLLADSLARLLTARGCEPRTAYSGPEALQIVQGFRPDLVFVDIGLPGMGGRELVRRLRLEAGLTEAALVALSGYEPDAERLPREAAFDDYVVKPLSANTLDAILAEHGRNASRSSAAKSMQEAVD